MTNLVSTSQLNELLARGAAVSLIATYWGPHKDAGFTRFASEHIPTSVYCDPAAALSGVPDFHVGRNPLPDPTRLRDWIQNWGVDEDSDVVVYDEGRGLFAARTWWTLRWAGLTNVRILDGGLAKWLSEDRVHIAGPGTLPGTSHFEPEAGAMPVLTLEEVRDFDGLLIDAREADRWAGRRELLDVRAGHIPGAVNVPVRSLLNEDNTFRSPGELREIFAAAGVTGPEDAKRTCVYSGSGNHSAQLLAGMELAGLPGAAHYIGGWSQWSYHDLPIASSL